MITDLWAAFWSIPHIGPLVTIAWLAYLVWLGGWIVLQKREPAATLSWLLSLALLPYLGFAIYYLFGPQKIRRQRLRRVRHRLDLSSLDIAGQNPEYGELQRMVQKATGNPLNSATRADLLVDGGHKYPRLIADIEHAKHTIHAEYYIVQPDRSGSALRDALLAAARRGVKVRLLMDAVGSAKAPARFFDALREAGGEVAWFHPMRFGRFLKFWKRPWLNLRTHRKIVVIDGQIGYIGGINITDDQDERINPRAYRDLHLRLEGDVVRDLQRVFLEDWVYASAQYDCVEMVLATMPAAQPGAIRSRSLPPARIRAGRQSTAPMSARSMPPATGSG